jgi:phosphatidate phosphatase APP1
LASKLEAIGAILSDYPQRRFVLVGDSGERDPEVYGEVARQRPDQVSRIYIRDVTGELPNASRYQRAFKDVPADKWRVFQEPETLAKTPAGPKGN